MEERWIFGPEQSSFLRSFIEEAFADAGLRMPPATVVSGSSYLRNSLLAAGPFLTILPAALLRYPRPHPDPDGAWPFACRQPDDRSGCYG